VTQTQTQTPTQSQPRAAAPTRTGAPTPTGAPPATAWAVVLALLLLAAGALLLRDAAVVEGLLDGTPFTTTLVDKLRSVRPQAYYVPAGVILALLGLWLVVSALRPRPRRDLAVGDTALVWLTPSAVASIARSTTSGVDGVVDARATATRRSVRVLARTTSADPELRRRISAAVEQSLQGLATTPTVCVTTRPMGDDS
jgi:hypothetical protein